MTFDHNINLDAPDGARLNLYIADAQTGPRAIVQINHGLAEHAARYGRFAAFLARRGFAVYAHDHRGHGHTRAVDAPVGSFARNRGAADTVIADVLAVHDLIARQHSNVPVIVFGHSMGALIALNFVLKHSSRIAGAAFWNGNFSAGLPGRAAQVILAWERFRLGSDTPSHLLPKLTFTRWGKQVTDNRTAFDWLSRDPNEVDKYIADPLCGWLPSIGMWQGVFDLIFQGADNRNFASVKHKLPVHLVGGENDPATDGGKAVKQLENRMRRMGFSNLVSTIYAQTRHESLNDINRDTVMNDFADWMVEQIVP